MAKRCALLLLASARNALGLPVGGSIQAFTPTELPGPGFPGPTALASNASWPGGHQPERLGAWPQTGYGTPNRTLLPCWKVTVLHDRERGWPGACLKLFNAKKFTTQEACKSLCWGEPRCPVWQFVNQTNPGQCWVGFGTDCADRAGKAGAISVQGAQRLMHGAVRVLKNLSGWKVNNLYQIGMFSQGNEHVSVQRCKAWCYSSIGCQYWQYGPGGCWVDAPMWSTSKGANPGNVVQYPLTTNGGATNSSSEAATMMYGEYIQHYCPPQVTPAPVLVPMASAPVVTSTPAPSGSGSPWFVYALLGSGVTFAAAGCAYYAIALKGGGKKGSSSRSSRSARLTSDFNEEDEYLMSTKQGGQMSEQPPPVEDFNIDAGYPGSARPGSMIDQGTAVRGGFDGPSPDLGYPTPQQQPQASYQSYYQSGYPQAQTIQSMPPAPTQLMEMPQMGMPGMPGMPGTPMLGQQVRGYPQPQLMQQGMPYPPPPRPQAMAPMGMEPRAFP